MKSIIVMVLLASLILFIGCGETPTPSQPTIKPSQASAPQLECLSSSSYREYDFFHVVGEVKNISGRKLEHVVAVMTCRTDDGIVIKTGEALIKYDPLMPAQTSPFEILIPDNPAITRVGLGFKLIHGEELPTKFAK